MMTLNAGASLKVRVHRITIRQTVVAAAAAFRVYSVMRTTTAAPTGGTAVTPAPHDTSDAASGATARTLPAAKGTEAAEIMRPALIVTQAILATAAQAADFWEWRQAPNAKPIIIPAGTTNGLVIKNLNASATLAFAIEIEFTETAF
jgi:hypothetical protein